MQIIVPKRYVGITPYDIVIFLAGPVLGGGDWQRYAIEHFIAESRRQWVSSYYEKIFPRIKFVVPCRWGKSHPLSAYFAPHYSVVEQSGIVEAGQTYWEVSYLFEVLRKEQGLIFFGLFPESKDEPRTDGVPYATDTRGELGRWPTVAAYEQALELLFIGAHPEFILGAVTSNLHYFAHDEWFSNNWKDIHTPLDLANWIVRVVWEEFQ